MTTSTAGPTCRFCGAAPAIETTVRGHQGFLIAMRFLKQKGPFCRTCGIATVRRVRRRRTGRGPCKPRAHRIHVDKDATGRPASNAS